MYVTENKLVKRPETVKSATCIHTRCDTIHVDIIPTNLLSFHHKLNVNSDIRGNEKLIRDLFMFGTRLMLILVMNIGDGMR